ncbi:MAG: TnpV protein [Ruminococcaceae bacterium]|nr:TnpV protein [Oscillospiraceae bacterium]
MKGVPRLTPLDADNQSAWVDQMNNIRGRATEMVNTDLIYG